MNTTYLMLFEDNIFLKRCCSIKCISTKIKMFLEIPKTDGDVIAQAVLLTDCPGEADSSLILTCFHLRAHTHTWKTLL